MGALTLSQVTKSFGKTDVIKGVDLNVDEGEFCVFVGPSGCGKSTLLRMIAGLEDVTSGEVALDGVRINDLPPARREIAMVFQSYALYPHLSVRDNMGLALKQAGVAKAEIAQATDRAGAMLALDALMERRPAELSGGQRQRVAIGRAIVRTPKLFLFDEPLSNLDAALRVQTRIEIARLHRDLGATMIYVTHDQVEAMTLADTIFVLQGGHVQQSGSPLDLYDNPSNRFVAGFIGSPSMNFFDATVTDHMADGIVARLDGQPDLSFQIPLRAATRPGPGTPVTLGIRPEHLAITTGPGLRVTVDVAEELGGVSYQHGTLAGGDAVVFQQTGARHGMRGTVQTVTPQTERIFAFGADGARLR